ncbi:MAG: Ig-like domain-containing protein [Caldilineaceae bacterium]
MQKLINQQWMRLALGLCLSIGFYLIVEPARLALAANSVITGTVTSESGITLADISVVLERFQPDSSGGGYWVTERMDVTKAEGLYTLTGLEAGRYRLLFADRRQPHQYLTEYYANAPTANLAQEILITDTMVMNNINAQLAMTGAITGTVTNRNGEPLDGVNIDLFRDHSNEIGQQPWQQQNTTVTHDGGHYNLSNLDPGRYRLKYYVYGSPRIYATEFYNDAGDFAQATNITVTSGLTTANLNAVLDAPGHITGHVTDEAGHPLAGITITPQKWQTTLDGQEQLDYYNSSATTDTNGDYDLADLDPGRYRLQFYDNTRQYQVEYYNNKVDYNVGDDINVGANGIVANIDAQLTAYGRITGVVTDLAGQPLNDITVEIYADPDETGIWSLLNASVTGKDGTYAISGLSGVYRVKFYDAASPSRYATEYYPDAKRLEDAKFVIVEMGANAIVDAKLAATGQVSGVVTDANGNLLEGINVTAYGDLDGNGVWDLLPANASTDNNGAYTLAGLDPGHYRLRFNDPNQHYAAEFYLDTLKLQTATDVVIVSGGAATANTQLGLSGSLHGVVTDANGAPLANIGVGLWTDLNGDGVWESIPGVGTDSNGAYAFSNLDAGVYQLSFNDNEYFDRVSGEYYNHAASVKDGTDVVVTSNADLVINAQLSPTGGISGVVTDKAGNPVYDGFQAYLYNDPDGDGIWTFAQYVAWVQDGGIYSFPRLDFGAYRVGFQDIPGGYLHYTSEFYNKAATLDGATNINVTAGVTTTQINAQLNAASHITGTVTDEQGHPLENIRVTVYAFLPGANGQPYWHELDSIYTNASGHYNLAVPSSNTYRIGFADTYNNQLDSEYYDNVGYVETATDIAVGVAMTVTNINAQLGLYDAVNFPPLARPDHLIVYEGGTTRMKFGGYPSVLIFDTDDHTNDLTAKLVSGPTHGTLTLNADGTFVYTHNGDGATSDSFTYRANDGVYDSNITTATITILQNNDPPVAVDDQVTVQEGSAVSVVNGGADSVLANDQDEEGAVLTATLVTSPTHGALIFHANGAFTYTHDGSETTRDFFTYRTTDGVNASNVATVTITVSPVNDPPVALNDAITVTENGAITGTSVLLNDSDVDSPLLTATLVTTPTHGTVLLHSDGTFIYTHDGSETTHDFFRYRAFDGFASSNLATVTITVLPVNDAPVAVADSVVVTQSRVTRSATSVLANDLDPDSPHLTATVVSSPTHGTLTLSANGLFTYTHDGGIAPIDHFTYRASDGLASSNLATVTLIINPLARFVFSNTVGIQGIQPECSALGEIHVPISTTIVYCYQIHNTGVVTLTTHTLDDSHWGRLLAGFSYPLPPGATYTYKITRTLTVSSTSVATWTATAGDVLAAAAQPSAATGGLPTAQATRTTQIRVAAENDDSDGDLIPDNVEGAGDVDHDNLPNFLDTDSDNDGVPDQVEAGSDPRHPVDSNNNGIPDYLEQVKTPTFTVSLYLPIIAR